MKAIKLASVFAVSAVAAAVSTSTLAAEPVFSGEAGLNYHAESGNENWTSEGEVNIIMDTGLVYFDLDMEGGDGAENAGFDLDEAYVKVGAVSFGDFDGSVSVDAAYNAAVWEEGEYEDGEKTDLGVRYKVTDNFTVAAEMAEGFDGVGGAFSYEHDLNGATLGLSAGSYEGDKNDEGNVTETLEVTDYSLGLKVPMGQAVLIASYSGGEINDADFESAVLGADIAITEAFAISAQFSADLENDVDNAELTAYYTVGDITYFATYLDGDQIDSDTGNEVEKEATTIGAYVSF
ncbi:hypothetical protein [Marinomonas ostreistagni]|uniref:hypothetical protein n=1 Tax=Marinomonas ostreistagni TaxID=359209 RepID=UPI00194E2746|nr:hypothetical protein [Marinomonas ostreistagni]MBM6549582.1 hypothetical protein [Marinomonas ostreistagni]